MFHRINNSATALSSLTLLGISIWHVVHRIRHRQKGPPFTARTDNGKCMRSSQPITSLGQHQRLLPVTKLNQLRRLLQHHANPCRYSVRWYEPPNHPTIKHQRIDDLCCCAVVSQMMSVWSSLARVFTPGKSVSPQALLVREGGSTDIASGQVVGEYVVDCKLGEGGFGAVYRAVHPVIGKTAAIKVLHPQYSSNADVVSRFVSEARAVNKIRDPHIIDIFSFGTLKDGRHYYIMELLDGITLHAYLEMSGKLDPDQALPILQGIARALETAHGAGIAHRDLKPENVFLATYDDGTVFPKILDFGVAKLLTTKGPKPVHKTATGTPIGTPHYMSPEQCQGEKVDHRADIYSFGVMTHRMLSGALPFEATNVWGLMLMHVSSPPPRLSEVVDGLPLAWDEPVLRMLEKDPERRPSTIADAFDGLLQTANSLGISLDSARVSFSTKAQEAIAKGRAGCQTASELPVRADTVRETALAPNKLWDLAIAVMGVALACFVGFSVAWVLRLVHPTPSSDSALVLSAIPQTPADSAPPGSAWPAIDAALARPPSSAMIVAADAASSSTSTASVVATSLVAWTFDTTPPGAEVLVDNRVLGRAPGPFLLPRGDTTQTVTVRAPGYDDEVVEVSALADQSIAVQLRRKVVRPVRIHTDTPKDLENPF